MTTSRVLTRELCLNTEEDPTEFTGTKVNTLRTFGIRVPIDPFSDGIVQWFIFSNRTKDSSPPCGVSFSLSVQNFSLLFHLFFLFMRLLGILTDGGTEILPVIVTETWDRKKK